MIEISDTRFLVKYIYLYSRKHYIIKYLPNPVTQFLNEDASFLISGLLHRSEQTFDTVPCAWRGGLQDVFFTLTEHIGRYLAPTSLPEIPRFSLLYQRCYPIMFSFLIWDFEEVLSKFSYIAITK